MADDADMADDIINRELLDALNRRKLNQTGAGAKFCVECGEEIPLERQNMGFKLCVLCAEDAERRGSLFVFK